MNTISFNSKRISEGYLNRPWLHRDIIEIIKRDLNITTSYQSGLDIGCGAGLSTKALKLICEKVTGTDISSEMINICKETYNDKLFNFYVAKAEETKIPEERYDIITAAGVINWIDKNSFLNNTDKILGPNGIIVIYDFWITDSMIDNPEYTNWYNNKYLNKFPKPPRNENKWTKEELPYNYHMLDQIEYTLSYDFSLNDFINFMMIQSNVNVQIENDILSENEVREWMIKSLRPVWKKETETLIFKAYNWYIKKD